MSSEKEKLTQIDLSSPETVRDNYFNDRYAAEAFKKLSIVEKKAFQSLIKTDSRTYTGLATIAFNKANGLMDRLLPKFIERDKTTKRLLYSGATIWTADSWNPVSPVGEIGIAVCFTAALIRGTYVHIKNKVSHNNDRNPK